MRRRASKKEEMVWQQYRLCIDVADHQILGGKHFLVLGPESGKTWMVEKGAISSEKSTIAQPASRERVVRTEWQVRTVLGDCMSRAKVIPTPAPPCANQRLPGPCPPMSTRRSSIGHELDQGST